MLVEKIKFIKNNEEGYGKNMKKERNYGIDCLRLVAMFMIVIIHILGKGGIVKAATGYKFAEAWFWEISTCCAVNCYAMISGYVYYSDSEKNFNYMRGASCSDFGYTDCIQSILVCHSLHRTFFYNPMA